MENETTGSDDILNAAEVAALLRIHPVTVRLQAAAGVIPGRQIGNRWRFSRKRIIEWMQTNNRGSGPDQDR
jgi:excisionase family DNA binding protein